jgi:hypothetical protein
MDRSHFVAAIWPVTSFPQSFSATTRPLFIKKQFSETFPLTLLRQAQKQGPPFSSRFQTVLFLFTIAN